jgi:AcrR family transcriptional regulator
MARTTTITDEQILKAARSVFLEEGFGAQTAKIARRAEVSEGTIFKRFPTKEALFFAALEIERSPAWHTEIDRRVGTGDLLDNLKAICLGILSFFNEMLPRSITTMGSMGPLLFKAFEGVEHPAVMDERKLRGFLEQEIELGRLRVCNTDLLAQVILGMMINLVFRSLTLGKPLTSENLSELAADSAELIWNGIAPD